MKRKQCIEQNVDNTIHKIQYKEYNEYTSMHIIQVTEYKAYNTLDKIQCQKTIKRINALDERNLNPL